jgi:hypothetical protein
VQALLPPDAPPPAAAEADGRGSEQAAKSMAENARTTMENTPWVPSDLRSDISLSKSENSHIAKNALRNARNRVPFARDRPTRPSLGWDKHLHGSVLERAGEKTHPGAGWQRPVGITYGEK